MSISSRIHGLALILLAITVGVSILSYRSLMQLTDWTTELGRIEASARDALLAEREFTAYRYRFLLFSNIGRDDDQSRASALVKTAEAAMDAALTNIGHGEQRILAEQIQSDIHGYFAQGDVLMRDRKTLLANAAALTDMAKSLKTLPTPDGTTPDQFARIQGLVATSVLAATNISATTLNFALEAASAVRLPANPPEPLQKAVRLASDSNAAVKVYIANVSETLGKRETPVREAFADFRAKQLSLADELRADVINQGTTLRIILMASAAAGVVFGLLAAFILARSIIRPIREMTTAMTRLAAGDGNVHIPGIGSANEIGKMAAAVNIFKENADKIAAMLKAEGTTKEIGGIINAAAAGDLTARVELADKTGFLKDIGAQVNRLLEASHSAFLDFREKAKGTALSVGEASLAVGQVSDGARLQNQSLTQVSVAVRESLQAIREVSDNTKLASEKAENASRLVDKGMESVETLTGIVDRIAQNSRRVNQITQVIAQIANRTHILSLNAAIEAARAGEHGKGFVIVAQEVGKLAESAGQNANQIAEIVEQAAMDTQAGKSATDFVRSAIAGISGETRVTTQMIHSSAAALEQQRASITQIDGSIGDLKTIANSNAAASEEIAATMIQLSRLADETRLRVDAFKMS